MRRCGVYHDDVRPRDYIAGLLVDLSMAMTEPCYLFQIRPGRQATMWKDRELYMSEYMVENPI